MPSLLWFSPIFTGLLLGLLAAVLHELGHLLAARALGVKVKAFGFRWKGLYMVRESGTPAKNLVISLAGPLTNSLFILSWPLSPSFGLANLCFAFFNILPIEGSDGERSWKCWREMQREDRENLAGMRINSTIDPSARPGVSTTTHVRHSPQIGD